MTRRKQTQPMQRKNSEEGATNEQEESSLAGDRQSEAELLVHEDRFQLGDRYDDDDDFVNRQMVVENIRGPSPSGTDVDAGSGCPSSSTPPRLNDEDNSSQSLHSGDRQPTRHEDLVEPEVALIASKITDADIASRATDERDTVSAATRMTSSVTPKSIHSAPISDLVNKYSLQHDDEMTTHGLGSSVAQLESFVASVATVDIKPLCVSSILPPPPPLVSALQSARTSPVIQTQSSTRHHSKPSKLKSTTPSVSRHTSKVSSACSVGKAAQKAVFNGPSPSSSALGLLMTQNPASMYSAVGSMAPAVPFQCVTGGPGLPSSSSAGAAATTGPRATGMTDQPLDLSSKSSRHETKYLSPDVSMSTSQGASSLFNLERQFGKGSAIFDRIGTKAWAAPYCATAAGVLRFGVGAYSPTAALGSSPALTVSDSSPLRTMAPPPPPPTLHSGGSSSSKSASGGRSAGVGRDETTPRMPTRRGHCSPTDASSLLPWAQPPDHRKHLPSSSSVNASAQQQHTHTNFRCSCGTTTDTLYELTLHVQKTGHSPAPPPSTVAQLSSNADTMKGGSGASVTGNRSTSGGGATGTGSASSSSSTSKPYEYSKLVRGQDVWLSGGGERTRRSILRCIECGESFRSLPELTVHMVHTRHYTNIVGAGSSSSNDAPSGGSSAHHHRKQLASGEKQTVSVSETSSIRSKTSSSTRTKKELPPTPPAESNVVTVSNSQSAMLSPMPRLERREESTRSVGDFQSENRGRKSLVSTAYSSDDDDDENDGDNDDVDSAARTPSRHRRDGDGGSSSCGGSRTSSPAGSTISTPTFGGLKRPWSTMTVSASAAHTDDNDGPLVSERRSRRLDDVGSRRVGELEESKYNSDVRVNKSSSVEEERHQADINGGGSIESPSTPVDCRHRLSPDGMSAEKKISTEHGDAVLKPLSPSVNTSHSSLSALKAMESFLRSSFGLNDHKQAAPSTPRSTGSPRCSNASDNWCFLSKSNDAGSYESLHISSPKMRSRDSTTVGTPPMDDSCMPTDLTSSSKRHRKSTDGNEKMTSVNSIPTTGRNSAAKKASPLTGTRDADSSTSVAGESNFSGNGDEAIDCRTTETAAKFSSRREESRKTVHGKKRFLGDNQPNDHCAKFAKNEACRQRESYTGRHQSPHHKSDKDEKPEADQERPTSSTSFGRRSALESLHGLVYGQTMNTEHPLDSLQRLIYGGGGGVCGGAATAADVGLTAETPGASALGSSSSSTTSLVAGIGSGFVNDLIHNHSVAAGNGPFGSTAFHSSLYGPQTLILVNPIVTVVSQAAGSGGTGCGGSSLSITLPGPPPAAAVPAESPSTPLHPLNYSKSTSGESSSSSAGSSPSDVGVSSALPAAAAAAAAAASGNGRTVDPQSAADQSGARSTTPPPRVYRCRACRRKFSSKGSYRYHLSRCHVLASSSLTSSKSPKAASEPPPATATEAVASATTSVTGDDNDVYQRPSSLMMSSMPGSVEVHSSNGPRPSNSSTSATTTSLSSTPYGGCLPLNGSARLQNRYLAMDAGAQ